MASSHSEWWRLTDSTSCEYDRSSCTLCFSLSAATHVVCVLSTLHRNAWHAFGRVCQRCVMLQSSAVLGGATVRFGLVYLTMAWAPALSMARAQGTVVAGLANTTVAPVAA